MAAKLPENMLEDFAVLLDNLDKLKAILDFPQCVGVGLHGLGRRIAASLDLNQGTVTDILFALWRFKRFCEARSEEPRETLAWLESRAPDVWLKAYRDKLTSGTETLCELVQGIGDDHPIMIAVKAQTLVYTHQNLYLGSRLVTDVRPVFNNDASKIDELVITHMLTIDYTDGSQQNTVITLAMDQEDIAQLHEQCERAATKILTLKDGLKEFPLVVMPDTLEGQ